jgi:hypothetical protein
MPNCQARVLDCEMTFPTLGEKYWTSKECGGSGKIKMTLEDGDSQMHLCKECSRRFIGRVKKPAEWYGWFDCAYPAGARVKFSGWWREMARAEAAASEKVVASKEAVAVASEKVVAAAAAHDEEPKELLAAMTKLVIISEEEELAKKIAELTAWIRTNVATIKGKEMAKLHKQLMDMKGQQKIMKRK